MKQVSLKFNYIYSLFYSILAMLLPLVTAPYISRVVGAEGLGIYSYNYTVVVYFTNFAFLGINFYGNRAIAKIREDYTKRSCVFSEIYTMQLVTSSVVIFFYIIYAFCVVSDNKVIALIMLLNMLTPAFSLNWFFNGLEMFKITVTRNIIIKLLTVILIFSYVKQVDDLWKYTLIMSLGTFFSEGYLILIVHKYVSYQKPRFKDVLKHFKQNFILFIPIFAVSVYRSMDKLMLKWLTDYEQVGYYTNAEKIINICLACITALGQVMLPKMTNLLSTGRDKQFKELLSKSLKFINVMTMAMMFGLFGVAEKFVPVFFGTGYNECIMLIKLLAFNLFFLAWGNVLKTEYLIPKEQDFLYIKSVIVGATLNFGLNLFLIPAFAARGAIIATLCAEVVSLTIIIISVNKELKIYRDLKVGIPYFIIGLIMYIAVCSVGNIHINEVLVLIIQIIIGVLIYSLSCCIYWFATGDNFGVSIKKILRSLIKHSRKKDIM